MPEDENKSIRVGGATAVEAERKRFVTPLRQGESAQRERLVSGRAWSDFCDAIKRSGEHMLSMDIDRDDLDYVDVFQYLAGIVEGGVRTAIDHADPAVPMWVHNGSGIKHSGHNADNHYLIAHLDPAKTYRIYGLRRSCHDMMFEVSNGYMQQGDALTFANLSFNETFTAEADGKFEIVASPAAQKGNWLPLHPDGRQLIIRMYFLDWETEEPASVAIEQIGAEGQPPASLGPARMAEILDHAAAWVESNSLFWLPWMEEYHRQEAQGVFNQAQRYEGGAEAVRYGNNAYSLAPGEALLLEGVPPRARYWSFQLQNNAMVSMDYRNHQTSLNSHQVQIDADGKYRIVVSQEDPGVVNWLDTCGRTSGLLIWRWVWTEDNPEVELQRVRFSALSEALPPGTRRITPQQRRAAITVRQRHVALRQRSC